MQYITISKAVALRRQLDSKYSHMGSQSRVQDRHMHAMECNLFLFAIIHCQHFVLSDFFL